MHLKMPARLHVPVYITNATTNTTALFLQLTLESMQSECPQQVCAHLSKLSSSSLRPCLAVQSHIMKIAGMCSVNLSLFRHSLLLSDIPAKSRRYLKFVCVCRVLVCDSVYVCVYACDELAWGCIWRHVKTRRRSTHLAGPAFVLAGFGTRGQVRGKARALHARIRAHVTCEFRAVCFLGHDGRGKGGCQVRESGWTGMRSGLTVEWRLSARSITWFGTRSGLLGSFRLIAL